jgi:hypothetical protein
MARNKRTAYSQLSDLNLKRVRSALSNGSAVVLGQVDQRSVWCRRLRDLIREQISDLGGDANLSTAQQILVKRAAWLTLQCELMESRWARLQEGEASAKQRQEYMQAVGALRRVLITLGLERKSRLVNSPSLKEYLRHRSRVIEAEAAE